MKKVDFLIIGIVVVIICAFYGFFFYEKNTSKDIAIEILYENEVIYSLKWTDSINEEVVIVGKNNNLVVTANGTTKIYEKEIKNDFSNTVLITSSEVTMIDASCKNHSCMRMRISKNATSPIVCTNSVIVRATKVDIEIIS